MRRHFGPIAHRSPRLSVRMRRAIYIVFAAVWTTGVLWLLFHYFMMRNGDFGVEPHPLEAWWLRLHGLCAFAVLWIGGWLWAAHARPALAFANRRRSGVAICAFFTILAASGYLLYYANDDALHDVVRLVHWIVGLALVVPFVAHALRTSRPRKRLREPKRGES